MRIINPSNAKVDGVDAERMEAFEKITSTILHRLQAIEDRIKALEETKKVKPPVIMEMAPPAPTIAPTPEPAQAQAQSQPQPQVVVQPFSVPIAFQGSLDAEAIRKGLLTKMWKYLNEKQAA